MPGPHAAGNLAAVPDHKRKALWACPAHQHPGGEGKMGHPGQVGPLMPDWLPVSGWGGGDVVADRSNYILVMKYEQG